VAAVVDHGDGHGPALLQRFAARCLEDLADFGLAEYGFALHGIPRVRGFYPLSRGFSCRVDIAFYIHRFGGSVKREPP